MNIRKDFESKLDKKEQVFEYRRSLKPSSYKYDILSIYRVRDTRDRSEETNANVSLSWVLRVPHLQYFSVVLAFYSNYLIDRNHMFDQIRVFEMLPSAKIFRFGLLL